MKELIFTSLYKEVNCTEAFPLSKTSLHRLSFLQVEYNGVAVGGTPFYCKVYDSESVAVSDVPRSTVGKTVTFAGKLTPFRS
jgi:hypothetical protein